MGRYPPTALLLLGEAYSARVAKATGSQGGSQKDHTPLTIYGIAVAFPVREHWTA